MSSIVSTAGKSQALPWFANSSGPCPPPQQARPLYYCFLATPDSFAVGNVFRICPNWGRAQLVQRNVFDWTQCWHEGLGWVYNLSKLLEVAGQHAYPQIPTGPHQAISLVDLVILDLGCLEVCLIKPDGACSGQTLFGRHSERPKGVGLTGGQ